MDSFHLFRQGCKIALLVLVGCVPQEIIIEKVAPCNQPPVQEFKKDLDICLDRTLRLEKECNPFNGNFAECPDWVYEKWYTPCDQEWSD
jgi:hypothetical protein